MSFRRRKRENGKAINCYVSLETYSYIASYMKGKCSLGVSVDEIVKDCRRAKERERKAARKDIN